MKRFWWGITYALVAALLFGASIPFTKLLLDGVDPWLMAGLLYLGAGIGLAVLQFGQRLSVFRQSGVALRRPDLPWLAAAVMAGGITAPALLMLGLARLDAASASLLLNLEGIDAMVIAWVIFREKADRRTVVGALAIVAGAAVLSWPKDNVALNMGAVLIAGACLAWAIDNNVTRKISASDANQITVIRGLVAGVANTGFPLLLGASLPPPRIIAEALIIGFLAYGVASALIVLGLRYLGAARMAAYFSTASFVGAAFAVLILGEPVSATLIAGGLLMAAGIWTHASEKRQRPTRHENLIGGESARANMRGQGNPEATTRPANH